jgi:hypothetical protein
MMRTLISAALAASLAVPVAADRAEDDLATVKRAVGSSAEPQARPPAEDPGRPSDDRNAKPRPRRGEPQWFHVRIVEKGEKHARVVVNLPLALVRAAGEDWRLPACHDREGRGPTLGEILRTLDSGQSLVEIESDDATVRVWVE